MKLLMIRHGRSTRLQDDRYGRRYDATLDQEYLSWLEPTRQYLAGVGHGWSVFSSEATRCKQTLRYCHGDAEPIEVPEFAPYHSGVFEFLRDSEVRTYWPQYYALDFASRFLHPRFGEESMAHQAARILPGLDWMMGLAAGRDVLLCTHCSVMNVIGCSLTGRSSEEECASGYFEVREGCYIQLEQGDDRWEVTASNCDRFDHRYRRAVASAG